MLIIILLVIAIPLVAFFGGAMLAMLGAMIGGITAAARAIVRSLRKGPKTP